MEKKLIRVLKMTAYYSLLGLFLQGLIVNVLLATSPIGGQNLSEIKIKVNAVNVSLEKAFQIIENKSKFRFSYSKEEIPIYHTVTIDAEEESMYDLLSNLAKEVGLTFNRINNQIVVKKSDLGTVESINLPLDAVTFKGKVTDKNGEPLIGASVIITQIRVGSATDIEGNYQFEVNKDLVFGTTVELTASYVNYKKKVVKVAVSSNEVRQNFELEEDIFQNEEIVVTGIASKTSKSISDVAITRIAVNEITAKQNFQSLSQLFVGKVPGVKVNLASGNVGAGWSFFIRDGGGINGSGQPLIYIDGVRLENIRFGYDTGGQFLSSLANLNPNDIENMEFLKGPAAASTYGTDASNGVVLITTKSGKGGGAATSGGRGYSIGYQFNYGVNSQVFKYPSTFSNADTATNPLFADNGYIREHSLSIRGGTGFITYFASLQNRFESGLIPAQNTLRRNNFRLNLNAVPSENLSIKLNATYAFSKIQRPFNDNSVYGWLLNALSYYPAYSRLKPEAIMAIEDRMNTTQFIGSLQASWRPIKDLEINVGAGIDNSFMQNTLLYPVTFVYSTSYVGSQSDFSRNGDNFTYDANIKYSFKDLFIPELNFTTIAGTQITERKNWSRNITVQNFLHPDVTNLAAGKDVTAKNTTNANNKQAGIFTENIFNYQDTYNFSFSFRRDFASAIGFEAPAITYPAAGLSVRLDKFNFLPTDFSLFKLRARYGESGQLPSADDGLPLMYSAFSGGTGLGYGFRSIGNVAIEPERIKSFELGFDTEFMKMFSLEFTYYNTAASNSIVNASSAASSGLGAYAVPTNIGGVKGHGYEASLRVNPIRNIDYDLNFTFNWSYQTNEVTNLGEATEIIGANQTPSVLRVGAKKWQFFDYVSTTPKFNATTQKYAGANQTATKVDLGNPYPDHSGTIAVDFRFLKNFNLSALMEWGVNVKVWSYSVRRAIAAYCYEPVLPMQIQLGLTTRTKEGVTPLTPGTQEYIDVANKYVKYDPGVYGNFVYDADYFFFRELTLSYDCTDLMKEYFPSGILTDLNVGLSVRNVFKLTKYEMDPDVNTNGGTVGGAGTDFATLPQPRTVNFWIRFNF